MLPRMLRPPPAARPGAPAVAAMMAAVGERGPRRRHLCTSAKLHRLHDRRQAAALSCVLPPLVTQRVRTCTTVRNFAHTRVTGMVITGAPPGGLGGGWARR